MAILAAPCLAEEPAIDFEAKVRPLLVQHCVKCHGPEKQKGGLRLDTKGDFLTGGEGGAVVVPGKPDESPLIRAIRYEDYEMPPTGRLAPEQIATLEAWVRSGANWPGEAHSGTSSAMGKPSSATRRPGNITEADKAWWAFQIPKESPVPVTGNAWAKTSIDQFLAQAHAEHGLEAAPEAEKATLIRRLTYDLIGLPPTPAEVDEFVADTNALAYEKMVDRLLASPRYGERQARFWLDLVRYAESDGYRADGGRPHAWRYRDYVIRSFNNDKPYDRFVQEQLAGDEIAPDDGEALLATGYLRLWPYEYNQRDVRGQWASILNDVTDVTADVFLGLGMGCARCHDHKFDPILQRDYYSLQSFFAGVSFRDEPVFPTPADKAQYTARHAQWAEKTSAIQTQINELLKPIRERDMKTATNRFTPDIQEILAKPAEQRTPGEQQLYELAYRQVQLEYDHAGGRVAKEKKEEYEALQKQLAAFASEKPAATIAMVAHDLGPRAADTVLPGNRKDPQLIEPAFPTVLGAETPRLEPLAHSTGRRAELAKWLTRPDHPLTGRVIVNRVWQQHFGRGLVATPSDFGTLGEKPSHPELLDWLTTQFVRDGWSLKQLHRQLVLTAAYRQSSQPRDLKRALEIDPENRWLARMPIRRLDAEQVRDAMFAVSGELQQVEGGPAVPAAQPRRSIFTRVVRNDLDPLLASFDVADGLSSCPQRNATVTPAQSLLLLNGKFALDRAKAFSGRVTKDTKRSDLDAVRDAFRIAYGRLPTAEEETEAREFLGAAFLDQSPPAAPMNAAERTARWLDFGHVLLNSNEFLYID